MEKIADTATLPSYRPGFKANFKSKGLALLIEHAPCCLLSFAAGLIGIQALAHNPAIEFGFAVGGAIIGEYIGHKYFHKRAEAMAHAHVPHFRRYDTLKRYVLALAIGLGTWGLHQQFFHDHHKHELEHLRGQSSLYMAPCTNLAVA